MQKEAEERLGEGGARRAPLAINRSYAPHRDTGWLGGTAPVCRRLTTLPCCSHIHGSAAAPGHDGGIACVWVEPDLRPPQPASANASSSHTTLTIITAAKTFIVSPCPLLGESVLGARLRVSAGDGGDDTRGYPSLLILGHHLTEVVFLEQSA